MTMQPGDRSVDDGAIRGCNAVTVLGGPVHDGSPPGDHVSAGAHVASAEMGVTDVPAQGAFGCGVLELFGVVVEDALSVVACGSHVVDLSGAGVISGRRVPGRVMHVGVGL